jgi:hypothetical protein
MKKFEYQVQVFGPGGKQSAGELQAALNRLGESGWEVATTFFNESSYLFFVLKKSKD